MRSEISWDRSRFGWEAKKVFATGTSQASALFYGSSFIRESLTCSARLQRMRIDIQRTELFGLMDISLSTRSLTVECSGQQASRGYQLTSTGGYRTAKASRCCLSPCRAFLFFLTAGGIHPSCFLLARPLPTCSTAMTESLLSLLLCSIHSSEFIFISKPELATFAVAHEMSCLHKRTMSASHIGMLPFCLRKCS